MPKRKAQARLPGVTSRPIEEAWRPWGSFHMLESGPGYKIKRLVVLPGQRLSLQRHRRRTEHWVVVAGTATVVNGTRTLPLRRRECAVIPRQAWHRIENHGRVPVIIIEVQHGTYLGEDDIVRKQDDYGRTVEREPRATSHEPRAESRGTRVVRRRTRAGARQK